MKRMSIFYFKFHPVSRDNAGLSYLCACLYSLGFQNVPLQKLCLMLISLSTAIHILTLPVYLNMCFLRFSKKGLAIAGFPVSTGPLMNGFRGLGWKYSGFHQRRKSQSPRLQFVWLHSSIYDSICAANRLQFWRTHSFLA